MSHKSASNFLVLEIYLLIFFCSFLSALSRLKFINFIVKCSRRLFLRRWWWWCDLFCLFLRRFLLREVDFDLEFFVEIIFRNSLLVLWEMFVDIFVDADLTFGMLVRMDISMECVIGEFCNWNWLVSYGE